MTTKAPKTRGRGLSAETIEGSNCVVEGIVEGVVEGVEDVVRDPLGGAADDGEVIAGSSGVVGESSKGVHDEENGINVGGDGVAARWPRIARN